MSNDDISHGSEEISNNEIRVCREPLVMVRVQTLESKLRQSEESDCYDKVDGPTLEIPVLKFILSRKFR